MDMKVKKVKVEAAGVSRVYYVLVLADGKEGGCYAQIDLL